MDSLLGYVRPAADNPAVNKAQALAVKDRIALEEEKGKSPEDAARSAALADVPEQVVRDAKVERFAESFDRYDVVRNAINSAARYLGNNPRKVKRFVNAFRLQALIANRRKLLEENVIDLDLLARWLVAETRWPELMSDILDDPGLLERAAEVRRLKSGDMPIEERMRRIQAMTDDIRVKRLTEADEAAEFITALRKQAGNRLEDYLHLGRMVGEAKAASAAVA